MISTALLSLLALSACGGDDAEPEETPEPTQEETPQEEPTATADGEGAEAPVGDEPEDGDGDGGEDAAEEPEAGEFSLAEYLNNTTWTYSSWTHDNHLELEIVDGQTVADYGSGEEEATTTFTVGEPVEEDLTGNGTTDVVVRITAETPGMTEILWYAWVGTGDQEQPLEQVPYALAEDQDCFNTVEHVMVVGDAIEVSEEAQPLATGARGVGMNGCNPLEGDADGREHELSTRTVQLEEIEGSWYPVTTDPQRSWGGVCRTPMAQHPDPWPGASVRVAPPASSETALEGTEISGSSLGDVDDAQLIYAYADETSGCYFVQE